MGLFITDFINPWDRLRLEKRASRIFPTLQTRRFFGGTPLPILAIAALRVVSVQGSAKMFLLYILG
jgi:hypothetical protein